MMTEEQRRLDRHGHHRTDEFRHVLCNPAIAILWRSWRDGYYHIYLYQFDNQNPLSGAAKLVQQLTHGDWEVESIEASTSSRALSTSSRTRATGDRQTCTQSGWTARTSTAYRKQDGTHTATFDPANAKYYVDNYSSLTTPPAHVAVHI